MMCKKFDTEIYLEKSSECFAVSVLCGDKGYYNSWANRCYYAFYMLGAIFLEKHNIDPQGEHKGEKYYKHSQIEQKLSFLIRYDKRLKKSQIPRYLKDLLRNRAIADYYTDRHVEEKDFNYVKDKLTKIYEEFQSLL